MSDFNPVAFCFTHEGHAVLELWRRRLGEYVRFRNGFYLFLGTSYHRFDDFLSLDCYVRDLVKKIEERFACAG